MLTATFEQSSLPVEVASAPTRRPSLRSTPQFRRTLTIRDALAPEREEIVRQTYSTARPFPASRLLHRRLRCFLKGMCKFQGRCALGPIHLLLEIVVARPRRSWHKRAACKAEGSRLRPAYWQVPDRQPDALADHHQGQWRGIDNLQSEISTPHRSKIMGQQRIPPNRM